MKYEKGDLVYLKHHGPEEIPIGVYLSHTEEDENRGLRLHHVWWLDMKESFYHQSNEIEHLQAIEGTK